MPGNPKNLRNARNLRTSQNPYYFTFKILKIAQGPNNLRNINNLWESAITRPILIAFEHFRTDPQNYIESFDYFPHFLKTESRGHPAIKTGLYLASNPPTGPGITLSGLAS